MSFSRFNKVYGHYTQVVWAETEELGCGMVYYKEGSQWETIVVCNYAVAGNLKGNSWFMIYFILDIHLINLGGEMYATGTACSACPAGYTCDDGLCSKAWSIML